MPAAPTSPTDHYSQFAPFPTNGHPQATADSFAWSKDAHHAAPPADQPATTAVKSGKSDSRPPFMLTVIALLGAALSFNHVRLTATATVGVDGGYMTACLFDAGMWLSNRWYIKTVRDGRPLRPALWVSLALVAVTLVVNVSPYHTLTGQIIHGIGPGLFAAFTFLEAALVLREYRQNNEVRDRIPLGFVLAHPARSARITLMMLGTGQKAFTTASAMCQNREAQRRSWATEHRPGWVKALGRAVRPGWRARVDPVLYTAYRWGRFDTNALILPSLGAGTRPGAERAVVAGSDSTSPADPPTAPSPDTGPGAADQVAAATGRAASPGAESMSAARIAGASRPRRIHPARRSYRHVSGLINGHASDTGTPGRSTGTGQNPPARPRPAKSTAADTGRKVAAVAARNPAWKPARVAVELGINERTARRHMTGR
jgi:hypothetical protein